MFCLGVRDNDLSKGDIDHFIDHFSTGHLLQHSLAGAIQYANRLLSCYNELNSIHAAITLVYSAVHTLHKAHIYFTHRKIPSELSSILERKLANYILECFQLYEGFSLTPKHGLISPTSQSSVPFMGSRSP